MKIYLGEKGLDKSQQDPFPKTIGCPKCGGEARIMFVGAEEGGEKECICNLHKYTGEKDYWLGDCCSVAVYLCKKDGCREATVLVNQS